MTYSYAVQVGDVLLCDINSTYSSGGTLPTIGTLTIPAYGGLCFNFHPGEDVQKNLDKNVYVVQKPGAPVGYEIGLGERIFTITTTIKAPTSTYASGIFRSLLDLNYLANYQYDKIVTASSHPSNGVVQFFYYGDGVQNSLYPVVVKSIWYEQRPGAGKMFDIRVALSEVVAP